jgi:succinate dehydrogenase/fumarate reductase flavoprotein subunit
MILRASLHRTESRSSHLREDYDARDDARWLRWVDLREKDGACELFETPIPLSLYAPQEHSSAVQRVVKAVMN